MTFYSKGKYDRQIPDREKIFPDNPPKSKLDLSGASVSLARILMAKKQIRLNEDEVFALLLDKGGLKRHTEHQGGFSVDEIGQVLKTFDLNLASKSVKLGELNFVDPRLDKVVHVELIGNSELIKLLPCMTGISNPDGGGYFAVIEKIDKKLIYVLDPFKGKTVYTEDEFVSRADFISIIY